jgi:hypothetical protein
MGCILDSCDWVSNTRRRWCLGATLIIRLDRVEYYLFKTEDESRRLREISVKRQNVRSVLAVNKAAGGK